MERKKPFFNLLQLKIHLGIQLILAVCFFGLGAFIYITQLDFLIADIRHQGAQQAEMVAEASVGPLQRESYFLLEEIATKAEYSPLVAYCQIMDRTGKSLLQNQVRSGLTRDDLAGAFGADDVTVVSQDIVFGGQNLGQVRVGMFIDKVRQEVQTNTIRLVAAFAAVLGIIALFLYVFLNRLLILPVVNLSMLTESLARGEFVTTTLDRRKDELGVLAQGFNTMSRNLKDLYRDLEKKVDARTEDLNNAYHELEAIFDNSLVGIAVLSSDHRVIRANSRFAGVFGYVPEEMPQISPEKFHTSGRSFDQFLEKFYHRLHESEIAQLEYQFRRKDGTVFWSQVSAKAIDVQDVGKGIVLVLEDISERKRASELLRQHAEDLRVAKEEADKATRSKSEFLARMSHEIRTPMNAILGMAEMLQESGLTDEQNEYVQTFSSAGDLLLGIINDILDFSKIEVGQIKLESIPFKLRELVGDVSKLFVYRAEEKGLDLNLDVAPGLAQRYLGDPTRIRQILINLLGNAIKFTSTGGVSLRVKESANEEGKPCCLFSVTDTGIGIPVTKAETIFDSFAQADSSTTREFGGTGLGLAITKRLVELMGGTIWIESTSGQGTTFFFRLPLEPAAQAEEEDRSPVLSADTRLLVLEDSPGADDSLSVLIKGWGLVPLTQNNPGEVVDLLGNLSPGEKFHAIVLDAEIGAEPGIAVAHMLAGQGLPVPHLILTVNTRQELAALPDAAGFMALTYVLREDLSHRLPILIRDLVAQAQQEAAGGDKIKTWKILLVDDVEANRRVVDLFLKSLNVTLVHAENGKIALEKFTEDDFDLVLMDMEMPVMDGLEATRRIRLWEDEKREYRTPIVALTAHAFQEHRQKTLDAGCTEFLAKPIKKQALINVVELYAGQHELLGAKTEPLVMREEARAADAIRVPLEFTQGLDSPVQIDPELEDLRPLFLRTVRDFQSQIVDALAAEDFQTIQRCGHSLKGLGSTYAVDEISEAGRIMEIAARDRQTAVVSEAFNHLAVFMDTGRAAKIQTVTGIDPQAAAEAAGEEVSGTRRYTVHVAPEMSELIPFLMDAMQKDLELMKKALAQNDFVTVRRFGHSHKGFGSTYGFDFISTVGLRIQRAAEDHDGERLAKLLEALDIYLSRVDIVYDSKMELMDQPIAEVPPAPDPGVNIRVQTEHLHIEVDAELYELIPLFMETMKTNIAELKLALVAKDYDTICRHGHSQKGLGSTYGFDYLGHIGFKIEAAAVQKNDQEIQILIDEMSEYLEKVRVTQREG